MTVGMGRARLFCRDCGHWEHDPGSCDALGHRFAGDLPLVGICWCEVHDDQRPSAAADLDVEALAAALRAIGQPDLIENAQWGYDALASSIAAAYAKEAKGA